MASKIVKGFAGWLFALIFLFTGGSLQAQPGLPAFPTNILLNAWTFPPEDTNWSAALPSLPLGFTNLVNAASWADSGGSLQVDFSGGPAFVSYPIIDSESGRTNITLAAGTASLFFSSDWDSGSGPGDFGLFLSGGEWSSNATGAFAFGVTPDGNQIFLSTQSGGQTFNSFILPIGWNAGDWNQLTLTYDNASSNATLYINGAYATNGTFVMPPFEAWSNSFTFGSDRATGLKQARGLIVNAATWNWALDAATVSNDYAAFSSQLPVIGGFFTEDLPSLPPGGGSGSSGGLTSGFQSYSSYTNTLWIEILPLGTNAYNSDTNNCTMLIHGTTTNIIYQLQSRPTLGTDSVWSVEQTLIGSSVTNFTPTVVSMTNRSTLFFEVISQADSDGGGLPDWWQLKYFGHLGVDPYGADSAGDGWNNLQKYQMGVPPNVFITPPPPANVTATVDSTGTNVTISWASGGGPVIGYAVVRGGTTNTVGSNSFSYFDNPGRGVFGDAWAPTTYQVQALFGNGVVAASPWVPAQVPGKETGAQLVRGPGCQLYLTLATPPPDLSFVRIIWGDFSIPFTVTWKGFNIAASNFVNGIYLLNSSNVSEVVGANSPLFVQSMSTNGQPGYLEGLLLPISEEMLSETMPLTFVDGRAHMLQNLEFFLRAATVSQGFAYDTSPTEDGAGWYYPESFLGHPPSPASYEFSGYRFYSPNYGFQLIQGSRPVQENYLLNNFVYNLAFINPTNGNLTNSVVVGYIGHENF